MNASLYIIFGILDILLQLTAAFFAVRIYKYNQLNKLWLAVPAGFLMMAVRRVIAILVYTEILTTIDLPLLDSVLFPLVISLLLVFGIWSMSKNFTDFKILEKNVSKKVHSFKQSRKKKR